MLEIVQGLRDPEEPKSGLPYCPVASSRSRGTHACRARRAEARHRDTPPVLSTCTTFLVYLNEAASKATPMQKHMIRLLAAEQLTAEENVEGIVRIMGWAR